MAVNEIDLGRVLGKSAYEQAYAGGYRGTEQEFNALLAGLPQYPTKTEVESALSKKANGFVGDVKSLGYTSLADIVTQGVYRIYDGPSFLTDYPLELSRDGLNYCTLTVDVDLDFISYHITASNAAATLTGEVVGFGTFRPPTPSVVSGWYRIATATPPEEHPLALEAGWTHINDADPLKYGKCGDGRVQIMGLIICPPNAVEGQTIATLPPGYRPTGRQAWIYALEVYTGLGYTIRVPPDGAMSLWGKSPSANAVLAIPVQTFPAT